MEEEAAVEEDEMPPRVRDTIATVVGVYVALQDIKFNTIKQSNMAEKKKRGQQKSKKIP
jgi:hypothetical protein